MNDDATLLRRFAEEGSEPAFTELVRRHVDLVYGAALRRVGGDTHRAADVSQQVFTTLAQQAAKLSRHTMLPAWLHTATRNAALNLMISENRRKARETEALVTAAQGSGDEAISDWDRLRPVLDAAIDELPETDRAAVIARFFERKPFVELGSTLNISADAARMRTERSLEKLRGVLVRRGITSTAVVLETLVASQPLISAPAGMATAFATQALAAGGLSAGATGVFLTLMNAKIVTTAGLSALAALSLGFYLGMDRTVSEPLPPQSETPQQIQMIASLRQENLRLKADVAQLNLSNQTLSAQLTARPTAASTAPTPTPQASNALMVLSQQRAMLNNLRQISAALDQYMLEYGRPPASMDDLVGEKKYIRRLVAIDGENYAGLTLLHGQLFSVTTQNGVTVTYNPAGNDRPAEPRQPDQSAVMRALLAYATAHAGARPSTPDALIPYFATPQEGADFVEAVEAQKKSGR